MIASADMQREGQTMEAALARRATAAMVAASFSTGVVDGGTYLGLHHVFIANQTGNLIFVALGAAQHGGFPILRSIVSLAGFASGAAAGGFVQRRGRPGRRCGPLLMLVGLALGLAAAASTASPLGGRAIDLLTFMLALTMGLQASAARVLAVADVPTVVVTSTLASLAAEPWFGNKRAERTARRAAAIAAMFTGAVLGAAAVRAAEWLPLLLAGALMLGVGSLVISIQHLADDERV